MGTKLGYEVWDADNHLYEAVDAYTRHLPKRYEGAIRFVDVNGRDKLEILGKVSETIPNPTYVVIPTPGAWTEYFRGNNPEGKSLRELAQPDPLPRRVPPPRPPAPAHGRAGRRRLRAVPHHRGPARGAHEGRPRAHARGGARVQPVAARGLDLRLRGPHHPDARRHAARRRRWRSPSSSGASTTAPDRAHPSRARCPQPDGSSLSTGAPAVRPVLAAAARTPASR